MIEIKNLSFGYRRKEQLFSDLSLALPEGHIYGLLGRNGAGKTTLLRILSGLLFPQSGVCEVMGYNPQRRCPSFLQEIYLIPEEFFVPSLPIATYEKLYASFYPRFDTQRFAEYLDEFDLSPKVWPSALSYGQKKKFLLAFGLATNCRLLLLDEPTNGMDIPSKSQFRKLVAGAQTEDRTFIISTHQVRDMDHLIDPILILDEGEIIFQQWVYDVSTRLCFDIQPDAPAVDEALYATEALGGYAVITENRTPEESSVDLEALFNGVIHSRSKMAAVFDNTKPRDLV